MVLKNNGNEADAADIFQDALLDMYQRAKDKEPIDFENQTLEDKTFELAE